jgi:hypothetical protein
MTGVLHGTTGRVAIGVLLLVVSGGWGALAMAQTASGQTAPLTYANPGNGDETATASDGSSVQASDASDGAYTPLPRGAAIKKRRRTRIIPYLEIDQSVYDQVSPHAPVETYTTAAAGVDVTFADARTTGVASLRYEHHFEEAGGIGNSNTFTGIARTTTEIVPRTLSFDFGGLATRTAIAPDGGILTNPVNNVGSLYQIWSVYGGPALSTRAGVVGIKAAYDVGYNEIDQLRAYVPAAGGAPVDLFSHSLSQQATASAGVRPGEVLPFGVTLMGSYLREDLSSLDQRLIDERAGVQFMQPVSRTVALVADVGWEKVVVSQRNAVIDANGNPETQANGQYVVDSSAPRQLAYKTDGLTWDVGVVWRPSRRTTASAYIGRRYDSTTYYGSLYHAPDSRQSLNLTVFDGIYGFGSGMMTALQQLPTDFTVTRDPFSGNVGGCFLGSTAGSCVTGALGSANALIFHTRGFNATYGVALGHMNLSLGGGYVSRRFIAAPDTVLASENGALDQTWYVDAGLSGPIDRQTRFYVNGFASLYRTDAFAYGDTGDWGINGSLIHHLSDRLVGTASFEVMGVRPQVSPDQLEMLGQVGLRYNFN